MKILNLLSSGDIGGIESLCKDIGIYSNDSNTFAFLFATGAVYDEMKAAGLDTIDLSSFSFPVRMAKLLSLSKQHDIIVSHHGSLGLSFFYVFLLMFNRKSKFVLTHHSCFDPKDYFFYKDPFRKALRKFNLKFSIKKSDRIIYVSNAGLKSFCDVFDVDRKKTAVIYNGIGEKEIVQGATNHPVFDGELRLLYIGRLSDVKGVDLLVEAISVLKAEIPLKAKIVGCGDEMENLVKAAKDKAVDDIISFEGKQLHKEKYYEWANAFIYPSVWQEVFGISMVEAMAFGLPCISNRVGGIPEIMNDENGVFTQSPDASGVVNAIRSLYYKFCAGALPEMSKNARMTAARFPITNTISQMHDLYEDILK